MHECNPHRLGILTARKKQDKEIDEDDKPKRLNFVKT